MVAATLSTPNSSKSTTKTPAARAGMTKSDQANTGGKDEAAAAAGRGGKKSAADALLESTPELRNTVAAIEKQYGEGSIMPLGGDNVRRVEAIPTGSLSLDIALGGQGIPRGRVIEIFGPESSGKTTL